MPQSTGPAGVPMAGLAPSPYSTEPAYWPPSKSTAPSPYVNVEEEASEPESAKPARRSKKITEVDPEASEPESADHDA